MILHAKSPVSGMRNAASAGVFCVPCRVPGTMPEITKLRKEHISGVLGFKGQNKGQTRFEAAKNP